MPDAITGLWAVATIEAVFAPIDGIPLLNAVLAAMLEALERQA